MKILLRIFLLFVSFQTALIVRSSFINNSKWEQATIILYATEIIVWLMITLHLKNNRPRFRISWLLIIFYFLFAIIRAPDHWLAFQTVRWLSEAIVLTVILRAGYLNQEKIVFWFACGSIFPALLAIAQFFGQTVWASSVLGTAAHPSWIAGASVVVTNAGRWLRAYGTFSHPNILGGFMALVIAMILFFLYEYQDRLSRKLNYFYYSILILTTAVLVLSFSRSAWLAWGVGMIIFYWRNFKQPNYSTGFFSMGIFISTITFIGLLVLLWPIVNTRVSLASANEVQSISERVTGYGDAWGIFKNNLLFGSGPGNFTVALHNKNSQLGGWGLQPVHNVWVLYLSEWGAVGSIFWFLFAKYILYAKFPTFAINLLPLLVLSFFDHYLYTTFVGMLMTVIYISSTVYPQSLLVEPKNSPIYPH